MLTYSPLAVFLLVFNSPIVNFCNFYRFVCTEILNEESGNNITHNLPLAPISDLEVMELARCIVKMPDALHYLLIDVRDWDAFRLLMRRHNAALCVVPIEDELAEEDQEPIQVSQSSTLKKSLKFFTGSGKEGLLLA
jgi:hypothetical protein